MTREELLAYAAGYVDGDGCITICHLKPPLGHKFRCIVEITSKSERSTRYLSGLLGEGRVDPQKDGTFRVRYWYQEAARVAGILSPYLYLKRRQAELVTTLHDRIASRKRFRALGISPEEFATRSSICAEIQRLNHSAEPLAINAPRGKRRTFAYIAGIIDAEGCLQIEKKGSEFSPVLHVRMQDGFVCKWITDNFGGYHLDPSPSNEIYTWGAERQVAVSCLRKVLPYLRVKREQAEILIRLQRHKDLWQSRLRGYRLPEEVLRKRQGWKDRVMDLNY